mmetsp:Transcript_76622/g.135182  ORF Transcript_76622/g.135182 Transcript_76622/m.135182 type:complete len:464 (-) Transcript_76622:43-1434(-)
MSNMKRSATVQIDKSELDFMVLEYSCRDSSVLSTLGKHCKESNWIISVGVDSVPIHITLHVDKQVALAPEVYVVCNGEKVFPSDPTKQKSKLKQDFRWSKPFRGTLRGLATKNYFEVRPEHLSHEQWYTATLTEQREDGLFKAILQMPDGQGGFHAVDMPAVKADNVREAGGMKRPVSLPYRTLHLEVPMKDPLHETTLSIDNEPVTHFFGRPTPPPEQQGEGKNRVSFAVTRDRSQVRGNVGHGVLDHFLSGEVRGVRQDADDLKHSWVFQIGPFAEHLIEMEKRFKSSNLVSLTVDGALLAECTSEDIECAEDTWECSFRLVGERFMDWEVYESDGNGLTLDSKGIVTHRSKYFHEVRVTVKESERSLIPARISVDGRDFTDLAEYRPLRQEDRVICPPQALTASYGLIVPYRVNEAAHLSPASFMSPLRYDGGLGQGGLFGLLSCCGKSHVEDDYGYPIH